MKRASSLVGAALLAFSSSARADHPTFAGVDAGGATINVFSPDTLERGRASAGLRLSHASPKRRSDEELGLLAGRHIHAHDSGHVLTAAAGIAYGLTDRLTISAELPYFRRDDLRAGKHSHVHGGSALNQVQTLGSVAGVGDATVLAKYKLVDRGGTQMALIGGVKLPTGSTRKRSSAGERLETEHQPGSGSWDPLIGGSFAIGIGPLRLNASALYHVSGRGAQDTRLGGRAQGGIGLSHRFGSTEHHHREVEHPHDGGSEPHHHEPPHGHSSWDSFVELTGEWEGRQKIAGELDNESGGSAVWLTPGVRFNSTRRWSAGLGVGVPVWQRIRESHPDSNYRITFSIGRSL